MIPACLLLCLGLASAGPVTISQFVVPDSVKVGDDVELRCEYELKEAESSLFYVKWWWTPLNAPDSRQPIYQRLGHHKPQSSHAGLLIKSNDTIELIDVDPTDSGTYECEVSNIDEERRKQDLFVYTPGTGPLLNASEVSDGPNDTDVLVTCEAFDVAPEPELAITVAGKEVPIKAVELSDPIEGLYSIAVNVTLEDDDVEDGSPITCELFYKNTNVKHEQYISSIAYVDSGAVRTTTELPEDSTQWETTTDATQGASVAVSSCCMLILTTVALAVRLCSYCRNTDTCM